MVTDRLGSVGGPARYYPYGQERQATPDGTEKFATYYRDATGLDYAWNRYYSPTWGRFMQADPSLAPQALKNPQAWNRYAYVAGDPVNYYDPAGLDPKFPPPLICWVDGFQVPEELCRSLLYSQEGGWTEGGGSAPRSLEEHFAIAYGVSEACARGLFETTSEKYRPRSSLDFGPFWEMVERANAHRAVLVAAAERWGVDWRMLAAIGVRESGFQNIAELGGGPGRGVFQIDIEANKGKVTEEQAFDLEFAANWAAKTLARNAETLAARYALGGERLWTLVIASYNAGIRRVRRAIDRRLARGGTIDQITSLDFLTTRENYARNVMDLMECFR